MKDHILNQNQKSILKKMSFLKKYNFYLAGGTALAVQLGHRTSQDLDFYTKQPFDNIKLIKDFQKVFGKEVKEKIREKNTLYLKIKQTDLSFIIYPYKLIKPSIPYSSVSLASCEDIAAMKVESILGRGKKRDFVDIYFLIKQYGLEKIFFFQKKKYPDIYNQKEYLNAMLYFQDAEQSSQDRPRLYLYSHLKWPEIKKGIVKSVKDYQLKKTQQGPCQ